MIVAFILNHVFNQWVCGGGESAVQTVVSEGAAAVDVPDEYPAVTIAVDITDAVAHYRVPPLLSPFALSTYQGS